MVGIGFEDLSFKFMSDYDVSVRGHLDQHGLTPGVVYGVRSYTSCGNRLVPNDYLKIGFTRSMHKRFRNYEQDGTHIRCEFLIYTDVNYDHRYQKSMLQELERQTQTLFDSHRVNPGHTYARELFAIPVQDSMDLLRDNLCAIRNYGNVTGMDIFEDGRNYESHSFRSRVLSHTNTTFESFFE